MASSDYVDDIQTIAKTKEIQAKADKAIKIAEKAEKAAINAVR